MSAPEMTHAYAPLWAPKVRGRYSPRVAGEDGLPEDQLVEAWCEACGARMGPRRCSSGRVRGLISSFAKDHVHEGG